MRNDGKASAYWEEGTRGDTGIPGCCSRKGGVPTAWEQASLWLMPAPHLQRDGDASHLPQCSRQERGRTHTAVSPRPSQQKVPPAGLRSEIPLTPALTPYLALCNREGRRAGPGPHQDPSPTAPRGLSPRSETESHRPGAQSCVTGTAIALEWNPSVTAG